LGGTASDQRNVKFDVNEQGELIAEVVDMYFSIQSPEDILGLKELLVDGIYNTTFSHSTVVLDVGMKGGLAAIWFASQPNVTVVGYEPSKDVYDQALHNIFLNQKFAEKIRVLPIGIGGVNFESIAGHYLKTTNQTDPRFEYEEVEINDIAMVIDAIIDEYPGRNVVIKIDFGSSVYFIDGVSEFIVINRLYETGKLDLIDTIMLKWYKSKPEYNPSAIARQLSDSGFSVFRLTPNHPTEGIIYAVRRMYPNLAESHPSSSRNLLVKEN
jgi:hypothetical protein